MEQKGAVHILLLVILLISIVTGVYLVQHPQIFKSKAHYMQVNPQLYKERVDNLRIKFKVSEDTPDDSVQNRVKNDLLTSNIRVEGDIANGDATVSVVGDCLDNEQTNYALSEYGAFPPLCLTDEQKQKAIEIVQSGVESAADFVLPYSQAKQALEFGSDIASMRDLLKQSGIAERNQLSVVSGPDSSFDGYAVTLIRIHELEEDVKNHPDGSDDLTADQEDARREYIAALRKLWEEQHNMLLGLATIAAAITIDKPLRLIGDAARPITEPIISKVAEVTDNSVFNFIKNSWENLTGRTINAGLKQISRWDEANNAFSKYLLPIFEPEQRAEASRIFEGWYKGNYNPETGKISIYRFVDLSDEMINEITQNGIKPRGVTTSGSIDQLLKDLDQGKGGRSYDTALAQAYRDQLVGKDISKVIEKTDTVGDHNYDIATYWTSYSDLNFGQDIISGQGRQYRITIEMDPDKAWRKETSQTIISQMKKNAEHFSQPDNVWIHNQPRNKDSFSRWSENEFEWTVLGEIPPNAIKEIKNLSN